MLSVYSAIVFFFFVGGLVGSFLYSAGTKKFGIEDTCHRPDQEDL